MEKRKIVGVILMALSIFIWITTSMLVELSRFIYRITGGDMVFFSYIGLVILFICGLYIFLSKNN